MSLNSKAILLLLFLWNCYSVSAQENDSLKTIKRNKTISIVAVSGTYVATNTVLYFAWYKDYNNGKFHFFNDNDEWLQMDKVGHFTTSYQVARLGYFLSTKSGFNQKQSCFGGGALGLAFLTGVEMMDGFSSGWGFSATDMAANVSGYLLFSTQQYFLKKQIFKMKFSYSASPYQKYRPELLGENPTQGILKDYNGQTYWLNINLNKLTGINKIPNFLELSLGYGGAGMLGGSNNPDYNKKGMLLPSFERTRQAYISLDIDLQQIKTKSKILKVIFGSVSYLKVPFPTIEFNEKGRTRFRPLYF